MTDHPGPLLSRYLDHDLDSGTRRIVEEHLSSCADCARELAGLQTIRDAAAELTDTPPPRDLWPAIEARIEAAAGATGTVSPGWRDRWSRRLPALAAAAVVVLAVSIPALWWSRSAPPPIADSGAPPAVEVVPVVEADAGLAEYALAMRDLEALIETHRDRLDPETVAVIESNIETVDRAFEEVAEALREDPGSPYLIDQLAEKRQRRLDLLRRATTAIQASL